MHSDTTMLGSVQQPAFLELRVKIPFVQMCLLQKILRQEDNFPTGKNLGGGQLPSAMTPLYVRLFQAGSLTVLYPLYYCLSRTGVNV